MRRFYIQLDTGEEVDSDTGLLVRFEECAALQARLDAMSASLRSTSSAQEQRLRDELTAVRHEFESVRLERVQLETLYAEARDETLALRKQVHELNNQLTTAILERDALKALLESQSRALTAALRHVDPQGD